MRDKFFAFAASDRFIALIDQGLLAVARFMAMLVFARVFSPDVFGTLALAVTLSYITVGINRSLVVLPFVFDSYSETRTRTNGPVWFTATLLIAAVLALLFVGLGLLLQSNETWGWIGDAFLWSAILCPLANVYEFVRRWIIQKRDTRTSLLQVITFNFSTLVLLFFCFVTGSEAVAVLSLAVPYFLGSWASVKSLGHDLRLDLSRALGAWRTNRSLCSWSFAEFLADMCVGYGLIAIVSTSLGPLASAAYSATRNIVAPIYASVAALGTVEPPRFARSLAQHGIEGLRRAFRTAMLLHMALALLTATAAFQYGDTALRLAYQSKFDGHSLELKIWIVAACLFSISRPFDSWLLALGHPHVLFYCKAVGAVAALIVAFLLLTPYGLPGVLIGMVTGLAVNCILLAVCRLRLTTPANSA